MSKCFKGIGEFGKQLQKYNFLQTSAIHQIFKKKKSKKGEKKKKLPGQHVGLVLVLNKMKSNHAIYHLHL